MQCGSWLPTLLRVDFKTSTSRDSIILSTTETVMTLPCHTLSTHRFVCLFRFFYCYLGSFLDYNFLNSIQQYFLLGYDISVHPNLATSTQPVHSHWLFCHPQKRFWISSIKFKSSSNDEKRLPQLGFAPSEPQSPTVILSGHNARHVFMVRDHKHSNTGDQLR